MHKSRPEPRKLPRQERSRALYDAVLVAAAELLEQIGPEFTLEAVAERAGVSPGSLYQYFPNRPALVGALIDRQIEEDRRALEAFRTSRPTGETETLLVEGALGLYARRPALLTHMVTLLREVGRERDVAEVIDEFAQEIASLLAPRDPPRSPEARLDIAKTAIAVVLGAVRERAAQKPSDLSSVPFRLRLVAIARAALNPE